jgi:cytochrome b
MRTKVTVWDLPTRIFHWALVLCVMGSAATAQIGGAAMAWHFRCGYAMLSLLLFRLIWGVVGGRWSRFTSFIYTPKATVTYLRGQGHPEQSIGHSPIGALSVFVLLATLMIQALTGLASDDEITSAGPLVGLVSSAWVSSATFYHANVGKLTLLGLLALHIGAIVFYQVGKNQNLIRPMIDGNKEVDVSIKGSKDNTATRLLAMAVLIGCALLVTSVVGLAV